MVLINSASLDIVNKTGGSLFYFLPVMASLPANVQLVLCGLVLNVFYRLPGVRKTINYSIANLVTSDILRAILTYFITAFYFMRRDHVSIGEEIYCVSIRYANNVQLSWSSWALVIIAYSRYTTASQTSSILS